MEDSIKFLEKLKAEIPYEPAILLLGIYPEKNMAPKDTCNVHCSTVSNGQDNETTYMSINRGMEKEDEVCVCVCVCVYIYIYTHICIYIYIYMCVCVCV